MTPRSKIVPIDHDASWDDVAANLAERPLTHYPVYRDSIDGIVGILDAKRVLLAEEKSARHGWRERLRLSWYCRNRWMPIPPVKRCAGEGHGW